MEYQSLGRTGVRVSPLCLGCMTFGGRTRASDAYAIVDRAIDAGINVFDTADVYNAGRGEEILGEALRRNNRRDRVLIATKGHGIMDRDDPNAWGNSRRHILAACEASLRRLGVDHIDLYQIHRPQSDVPIDETLRALDDLVRAGKVRYIGTSTFAAWQIVESLWASERLHLNRFVSEQPPYNLLDRRAERELIPMCRTHGIAVLPWSPLGGGLLTGKYRRDTPPPANSRFADGPRDGPPSRRLNEHVFDVVDALEPIAAARGCTLSQLALAWCCAQPGVTSVIVGPRTLAQLEDNLGAADVLFSADDLAALDETCPPGGMISPFYEADFGPHPFPW